MSDQITRDLNLLTVGEVVEALLQLDQTKALYLTMGHIKSIIQFHQEKDVDGVVLSEGDYAIAPASVDHSFEAVDVKQLTPHLKLRQLINNGVNEAYKAPRYDY